jgi:hypothetical protein
MSDTFNIDYLPTESAPAGTIGTSNDYASSFGGAQLPQAPAFQQPTYQAPVSADVGTPTQYSQQVSTDTGSYFPTFNFTPTVTSPSYTGTSGQFLESPVQGVAPIYGATQQNVPFGQLASISGGAGGFQPNLYSTPAGPAMPTADQFQQIVKDMQQPGGPASTEQPQAKNPLDQLLGKLDLTKLLIGGAGGLMSYLAAQKAQQDAANARAEYEAAAQKAAADTKALAQPYLTAGGTALSQALQGSLSPAQMQQYQAQQAQLAQQAARSGGIGAVQTAAAEQAMYQQALAAQQQMALQLLGPGNQLASNAIMTELQGTQGGLQMEMNYGMQAAQAMGNMMSSLGYGVGATPTKAQ